MIDRGRACIVDVRTVGTLKSISKSICSEGTLDHRKKQTPGVHLIKLFVDLLHALEVSKELCDDRTVRQREQLCILRSAAHKSGDRSMRQLKFSHPSTQIHAHRNGCWRFSGHSGGSFATQIWNCGYATQICTPDPHEKAHAHCTVLAYDFFHPREDFLSQLGFI